MNIKKTNLPNQGSAAAAELCSAITEAPNDLNVQQRVAFAANLFQSDVTLRTLLESLAEGVVIIDSTATIILVNRQAERLFGYTKQEIVGQPLNLLLPAKFHSSHPKHVAEYFEKPKIRPMGLEQELTARHKSGQNFPVEISLSHLETTSGSLAMAFITDITLRRDAINSLESRNEELDAFAHTVAHDLKGSLATLIGYSELLNDHEVTLSEEQIRSSLDIVNRMSRKMADVVDGLLLLSSISREDVIADPLDMTSIINEAIFRLSEKIQESGAEISTAQYFPAAMGYAPWLEEVWYNYISNALKYGGTPPKILLGGELVGDGCARFWVKDNGPGLRQSEQAQLFVPYSSRANHSDGNGLGLSIVKRIVGKLHGSVKVESKINEGSLFSFTLPVMK